MNRGVAVAALDESETVVVVAVEVAVAVAVNCRVGGRIAVRRACGRSDRHCLSVECSRCVVVGELMQNAVSHAACLCRACVDVIRWHCCRCWMLMS